MFVKVEIPSLNSGLSRPSDKGGAEISGGGGGLKIFFPPFDPHFGLFEAPTEKIESAKLRKRKHQNKKGRNWEEERSFSRLRPLFAGRP